MLEQFLAVHLLAQMRQTVGPFVQVRLVNLEYVAGENHLRAFSGPGDDCLDFMRGDVLGLIADEIHFPQTPSADVRKRGDEEFFALEHLLYLQSLLARRPELGLYHVEIVHQRLDERTHLCLLVTRQETDLLVAKHHGRSCQDDLLIVPGLLQGRGKGNKGLSGSGASCHRHQLDLRIEAGIDGEFLLVVPRSDSVGRLFRHRHRTWRR